MAGSGRSVTPQRFVVGSRGPTGRKSGDSGSVPFARPKRGVSVKVSETIRFAKSEGPEIVENSSVSRIGCHGLSALLKRRESRYPRQSA